ncbi:hypothetical protein PQU92_04990 [Asticcacaulis sp. BYS171W]|uniref:Uncharacterized protein n=1 Tax=Asticcacaulis aquaticus TaxID=2984212 RepID=A0ABT5HRE2_9CAUL|nr:hypothetical protein [Asticcacaulis aquaticus]MDC7682619.1 hypothetical protein [Asticcacaulis aquaticus]
MKTLGKWIVSAVAIAAVVFIPVIVLYLGEKHADQKGTHYKIAAWVQIGGHIYSGSTVQAYHCPGVRYFRNVTASGRCRILGEALAVDTPDGRVLFLLKSSVAGDPLITGSPDILARNIEQALSTDGDLKAYLGPQLAISTPQGVRTIRTSDIEVVSIHLTRTSLPVQYGQIPAEITKSLPSDIKRYDLIARH